MATPHAPRHATLIPAQRQMLWKWPAVGNFVLGGLGAGFYLVATIAAGFGASPAVSLAAWLGPALVGAGFLAVAVEAGQPFRGVRVLTRVRTSWMSRELWIGGTFIVLAAAEVVEPAATVRPLAALAALGLVLAQGYLIRAARGIAAWNVTVMPAVFVVSALLSGLGLLLLEEVLAGRAPATAVLGLTLPLLAIGLIVWLGYLTWTDETAFVTATASLRAGAVAVALIGVGYVAPFVAGALALALPTLAPVLAVVAAATMILGQARAKWALILDAGYLRPITIHQPSTRRSS